MEINKKNIQDLINKIEAILISSERIEKKFSDEIQNTHPLFRKSAKNLLHYLALRNHDIRTTQELLAAIGLSSLGRAEGHVKASLYAVRKLLYKINGIQKADNVDKDIISFKLNRKLLEANTSKLLGTPRGKRRGRIMVTLSQETAEDYKLIRNLINKGMDCARINCAHDNAEVWIKMVDHINRAKKETGLKCKILMDLGGIKLRTGPLKTGPGIMKIKAKRDFYGKLIGPAKIWLAPAGSIVPIGMDNVIPVEDKESLMKLQIGDKVKFQDVRGKKRKFKITECNQHGCKADLLKRTFIESETILFIEDKKRDIAPFKVGNLPPIKYPIILKKEDILILHKASVLGEAAKYDELGQIIEPAHISCSMPEIFNDVKAGEPILFNDGKIEGIINVATHEMLIIKITQAKDSGNKLDADKGINLPESNISFSGLTEKDIEDLKFVSRHADIVNMSFVNTIDDVFALQKELEKLNASHIHIMLKIETQRGFKNLPFLLLAAMKGHPVGVMIARGDLAVECGWKRLAEVQEEILWLCEAAQVPVVWATQVLESLAKKGSPSRAEITDAAMSQRADCVMLNKGPYILQAVETLSDILERMEAHQHKKTSMLRSLRISEVFNLKN